jgi:hypothetical protein
MVRRTDDDRIKVVDVQQSPVVLELPRVGADLPARKIEIRLIQVADRYHFGVSLLEEAIQHLITSVSEADKTEPDSIIGPQLLHAGERRCNACRRQSLGKSSSR